MFYFNSSNLTDFFPGFLEQLDKAAPQLADGVPPIMVAKIDADKYRSMIEKYDIRYVFGHCSLL